MTFSEKLFEEFCRSNGIACTRVRTDREPTPDFDIELAGHIVTCEVKQIDPNRADLDEFTVIQTGESSGRHLANRLRAKLKKKVSSQVRAAADAGRPTLLVLYDNTPFKSYSMHSDVVQAMLGHHSVTIRQPPGGTDPLDVSQPFFGGDRGLAPGHNTAISAIAILDGGPISRPLMLRVYHNPYSRVRLDPRVLSSLPVTQPMLPDAKEISL